MTKETYLEMCSQLGNEPLDSELPIEIDDLPVDVEQAYHVYNILPDKIDSFNDVYYGKALEHAPSILEFLDITPRKDIFKLILIIDSLEREEINRKRKNGR